MTSTMTRVAAAEIAPGDTSKYVKYTFGMLLGVEDFKQEHTYLSGRDRWLARDLLGYGTVWGLSVAIERPPEGGPRINVDRGVGVTPLGELVCVPSMQCAYLEPWLVKHAEEVGQALPEGGLLPVYVVLCYRSQFTDAVPIPGEPCRSEDELTAPSRVQDGFELELRLTPPAQVEENAIREFVSLLRPIEIVDGVGTELDDFLAAIREAALPVATPSAGSPPAGLLMGPLATDLKIPRADLTDYLRAAFRLWVTEIRPKYRLDVGCGADECPPDDSDACLLLAEVALPILVEAAEPRRWFLDPDPDHAVAVDERERPYLLHERMLQEWMLTGSSPGHDIASPPDGGSPPPASSPPGGGTGSLTGQAFIVAAGQVDDSAAGLLTWSWGEPTVTMLEGPTYCFTFDGFNAEHHYVVKGTPIRPGDSRLRIFEVISDEIAKGVPGGDDLIGKGIFVRLTTVDGDVEKGPFMIEVSDFSEPA